MAIKHDYQHPVRQKKENIKLLFVNPSPMPFTEQKGLLDDLETSRVPDFKVPLGILELVSYARKNVQDIDFELLDVAADLHNVYRDITSSENSKQDNLNSKNFYVNEIESINMIPDIVGISVLFSSAYYSALELAKLLKIKWPHVTILAGGNHATAFFKPMLEDPNIDLVFRGEAETSLVEYLKNFKHSQVKKLNLKNILGVYDQEKAKKIDKKNAESAVMLENLDEIGIPAYDLLNLDIYKKTTDFHGTGHLSVMWSRGCPYKCTFCSSHVVHGRDIRYKSNERIIEELLYVKNLGFDGIAVYDDLFAAKRKKFLSLVDNMIEADLVGDTKYLLYNSLSVTVMNEKVIDAIERMGVEDFKLSIESGSQYTQDNIIYKNVNMVKARNVLDYMRTKPNITIEAIFILGFPNETRELMQETIDFIDSIDVDWVTIFSAIPLPGSDMYEELIELGYISEDTFNWDMNRLPLRDFDTPEIGKDELPQLVYDTNISSNYFNNSNIKHGRYERAIHSFNNVVLKRYPWHVVALYCRGLAYFKMNQIEKSEKDFIQCVNYINSDQRSKRMFQRYGNRMELLIEYFSEDEKNNIKGIEDWRTVQVHTGQLSKEVAMGNEFNPIL